MLMFIFKRVPSLYCLNSVFRSSTEKGKKERDDHLFLEHGMTHLVIFPVILFFADLIVALSYLDECHTFLPISVVLV